MNKLPPKPNFDPRDDIDHVIHAPARLMIVSHLYVVDSMDCVFLMRITGMTWGNLSTHLTKLENVGYIVIKKGYKGKKPHTTIKLSKLGRKAFKNYRRNMMQILDDLPD